MQNKTMRCTAVTFLGLVSLAGVTLSANIIVLAFGACYLIAGFIGMPIAFLLRRHNSLSAWTIHGAALTWGILWSLFCTVVATYVAVAIGADIQSLPLTTGWFMAPMVPPVVLAGTAFWLLLKRPKIFWRA